MLTLMPCGQGVNLALVKQLEEARGTKHHDNHHRREKIRRVLKQDDLP